MRRLKNFFTPLLAIIILISCQSQKPEVAPVNLIPTPVSMTVNKGYFQVDEETVIQLVNPDADSRWVAGYIKDMFSAVNPWELTIDEGGSAEANTIILELTDQVEVEEGYELKVSPDKVKVRAKSAIGLFYAVQTIRQLLPLEIDAQKLQRRARWTIPAVNIKDEPRFGWRGLHLDVSRHFFPKEFIKKYLDHMARYKLNVFHWHLVDGPGWRIEIDKYPKLTEVGAWRVDKRKEAWDWSATEIGKPTDGRPAYGGFYTKDDIREIIAYAKERFIEVIPEIEMPGHSYAALAAYPELICVDNDIIGNIQFGTDAFCAGNEKSYEFLRNVIDEVIELFPSKLIHIGGDEVVKTAWHNCSRCQNLMKRENLKDEEELQSHFISRMAAYIESKGKEIIGWDEILEGGLAENAKVMSWRGMQGGIKSANMGHDVVMAPNSYTYFDLYQGDQELEPPAYSQLLLTQVYKFDPIPADIDEDKKHHILGGHAALWTETVQTPEHAEYMLFPRLFAMAETVWSPKKNLDWASFKDRMEFNFNRLNEAGINYARSAYNVKIDGVLDTTNYHLEVVMSNELDRYEIRYTLDGSEPGEDAEVYKGPFTLTEKADIKAATFKDGKPYGKVSYKEFNLHLASGKSIEYTTLWNPRYPGSGKGTLVNGLTGSANYRDGQWLGFQEDDIEVVIDLESEQSVSSIRTHFNHKPNSWVYLPEYVTYAISSDGINFTEIARTGDIDEKVTGVNEYTSTFEAVKARYIKVFAKNIEHRPHNKDQKAWVFIDEIIVD